MSRRPFQSDTGKSDSPKSRLRAPFQRKHLHRQALVRDWLLRGFGAVPVGKAGFSNKRDFLVLPVEKALPVEKVSPVEKAGFLNGSLN